MLSFRNWKVGTKILTGYVIALVLTAIVGGVALFGLNRINTTVSTLTEDLAPDLHLADTIVAQIWTNRLFALRYIDQENPEDLNRFNQERQNFEALLQDAYGQIADVERVAMLDSISAGVETYNLAFDQAVQSLEAVNRTQVDVLDVYGPLAEQKLQDLRTSAFEDEDSVAAHHAGDVQRNLLLMRLNAFKYMEDGDPLWSQMFEERYQAAQVSYNILDQELQDPQRRQLAEESWAAIQTYRDGFVSLETSFEQLQDAVDNTMNVVGPQVRQTGVTMSETVDQDFQAEQVASRVLATQIQWLIIGSLALAMVSGLGLGLVISRGITGPLKRVTEASERMVNGDLQNMAAEIKAMAAGDLTRKIKVESRPVAIDTRDEIGQMAGAYNAIVNRFQDIGVAFGDMAVNLRQLVGQVSDTARQVGSASEQLSASSSQASEGTAQVAMTVSEVAAGTARQTDSMNTATMMVNDVTQAINGIARGAQEQANAVARASTVTNELSQVIRQVATNAQTGAQGAEEAARTAREGAGTIQETVKGMQSIKLKVDLSAQKVQEMGQRSDQIGAIVETIDDIASQTNLLALNAAIEAARAGEHGKGFAVVADEVRKLAEKSAAATKEIGTLISSIQVTVNEAVVAMNEGAMEVQAGVERADVAGKALDGILSVSETVNTRVEEIASASQQMEAAADELVSAVETVSAVVEENTAATEEMTASASQVMDAIESSASVSEENSAAVEEVGATAEEVSSQVEEVSRSSQYLSEMALSLQKLVSQFKLSAEDVVAAVNANETADDGDFVWAEGATETTLVAAPHNVHNGRNGHNGH